MIATRPAHRTHFFSVDVEEYFHVSAFEDVVQRDRWHEYPSRIDASIDILLGLLARHRATATFFVLGWVADRRPDLVRRIAAGGHEIASHGWSHRRVTSLTPAEFRAEVRESKRLLEDVAGKPVLGYRAPSFSIIPGREWALDVLVEEGYVYDSSLFPIVRRGYGYPSAPAEPHVLQRAAGALIELPPATLQVLGTRIPAAGGGYLRQFPYAVIERAFEERSRAHLPGMFYIHPWELDPEQPRMPVALPTRVRHYRGLSQTAARVQRLLASFRFSSVERLLKLQRPLSVRRPALVP